MKIVVFEVEPWEREPFESLAGNHEIVYVREALTARNVSDYSDAEAISPFIYSKMESEVLERFDRLQLVSTRSTGYDHIDRGYCKANGVTVCNVPSYGEKTVAEHVFALLLAISHHIVEAVDRTRRGDFSQKGIRGFDLHGKTLGVLGTGAIGEHAIRIAGGFGMDVIAFDVKPRETLAAELGFSYVSMEDLLRHSDVLTLHVPLNEHTRGLIGEREFDFMKQGVVLVNTSRGDVVSVTALLRALSSGKVLAAGLDVLPEEPIVREEAELLSSVFQKQHNLETLLADHVLLRMRNVIITPHSAFNTREAVWRILDTTVGNITAFADGKPRNVVIG